MAKLLVSLTDCSYATKRGIVMRLIPAATIALISFQPASGHTPAALVGTIVLPGVEGGIDHRAVDAEAQRLYEMR